MALTFVNSQTDTERARANYHPLLEFAKHVKNQSNFVDCPVTVADVGDGMGMGLKAVRDIEEGETVVWYGGPCVLAECLNRTLEHVSHAVAFHDLKKGLNQKRCAIDGKIVSVAFRDASVTDEEKKLLLVISGGMSNSSKDLGRECSMMELDRDKLLTWTSPEGIKHAALPFVAVDEIKEGTECLWHYQHYYDVKADPCVFPDMLGLAESPLQPPPPRKRRITLTPLTAPKPGSASGSAPGSTPDSTSQCYCGKILKVGADTRGLASLVHLRL